MTDGGMSALARSGGDLMDETRFGLRERPFQPIPTTESYYPATTHEQALAQLLQAIKVNEGLGLVTGEPGTGKTTICLCLLERIGNEHATAFITHCHFAQRLDLLQAILYDFSLPYRGYSEQELRLSLVEFAIKNYEAGKRTVLILDEAQHLSSDLLEELRLLGNLDGNRGKAIQIVLAAQPSILETLCRPELAVFSQRLAVRARLQPLGVHESADYIVHGLRVAGGDGKSIVSDEALEVLARGGQGIPRLLNRAADKGLELACGAGENQLDVEAAMEALIQLGLAEDERSVADEEPCLCSDDKPCEDRTTTDEAPEPPAATSWDEKPKKEASGVRDVTKEATRARRLFAPPRRPA
jgi:general secretion pathway protein A